MSPAYLFNRIDNLLIDYDESETSEYYIEKSFKIDSNVYSFELEGFTVVDAKMNKSMTKLVVVYREDKCQSNYACLLFGVIIDRIKGKCFPLIGLLTTIPSQQYKQCMFNSNCITNEETLVVLWKDGKMTKVILDNN